MRKMNVGGRWFGAVVSSVAICLLALPVQAQGAAEEWRYELTPYLFAAGIEGTVGVRGVAVQADIGFSDLLENLDSGFMGLFEARKGRWTFGLDVLYTKVEVNGTRAWEGPLGGGTAALDTSFTTQIYQPFVGYRMLDESVKLDLIGGARYTKLDIKADLSTVTGPALLPDGSRGVSGSESWWDPIVGVRLAAPIADRWTFVGYADVGGGGDTDVTYQFVAGVNWEISKQYSAKLGYRYLSQDYEKGGLRWDVALQGVYLGLGIRF